MKAHARRAVRDDASGSGVPYEREVELALAPPVERLITLENLRPRYAPDEETVALHRLIPDPRFYPIDEFRACVDAALREEGAELFSYASPEGHLELRRAMSERFGRFGIRHAAEEHVLCHGASQGISLALRLFTQPGDQVAVEVPTYANVLSAFAGLGLTAAPVAMVKQGYGVDNAALGIQWHLLAMFGPSFFTGRLMARFGKERVTAFGLVLLAGSGAVALSGAALSNFWGSLALLGVGWNFSFIGATAMVTDCHTPAERGKAQGANDFLVFGVTAIVSFLAGSVMHSAGWVVINWAILPALALMLVPLVWQASRAKVAP